MAMMAAASMTHDRGFHMNPRNLRNLLSWSHKTHPSIMLNTTLMRETHRETGTREARMRIRVYLLLLQLVEPEDFDALLGLRGGETLAAASQVVEHLLERDVLLQRHKKRITSQFQTTPRGVGQVRGDKRTRFLRRLKDKPRSGNELLHEEGEEQNWCRLGRKKEGAVRIKGGRKKQSLTKKTAATSITAGLQRNGGPQRTDSSRFNSTDGGETATPLEATKFHPTRSTKPGTEEAVGGLTRSTASLSTASRLPPLSSILASLGRRRRKAPEQRENYQSNTAARAPVAGRKETGGNGGRGGARSEIVGGGIR
jgi:hypothetical protein